jgi:hypothetical protein
MWIILPSSLEFVDLFQRSVFQALAGIRLCGSLDEPISSFGRNYLPDIGMYEIAR